MTTYGCVNRLGQAAQTQSARTGIPASVFIAIAVQESGPNCPGDAPVGVPGQSSDPNYYNNPYGIFAGGPGCGQFANGSCLTRFSSIDAATAYLADLLSGQKGGDYGIHWRAAQNTGDWSGFVQAIAPQYAGENPAPGQTSADWANAINALARSIEQQLPGLNPGAAGPGPSSLGSGSGSSSGSGNPVGNAAGAVVGAVGNAAGAAAGAIGNVLGSAGSAVTSTAGNALSNVPSLGAIGQVLSDLTNKTLWERVGLAIVGGLLAIMGVAVIITGHLESPQQSIKTAAEAA